MSNAVFNFNYNRAHTTNVEFKTIVDEATSGKEQRRDMWERPQRRWTLEMDKNKVDREALVNFFIQQKGQKHAFDWTWETDKGGDGQTYRVRFAKDKLELNILELGYSNFKIELVEVFE
jgi:hypothetical protein